MNKSTLISGKTFLIIIGIEQYLNSSIFKKVRYAKKDALELKEAFIKSEDIQEEDIIFLTDEKATKSSINTELKQVTRKATRFDRIIFFFAGHGLFSNEQNYIAPYDAYNTDVANTCISINNILSVLKKSDSKRNIIFLDCCHSGFEPGDSDRSINSSFEIDDLLYLYKDEEYCSGFASSKSHQESVSNDILKNGVWSSYLIKALTGKADRKIYEDGILFNDKLQSYLNKNVQDFVKMNTPDRKDQTPTVFGNFTDRFPIMDLNPIFQEEIISQSYSNLSFDQISMISEDFGNIKDLSGFVKGSHTAPKFNSTSSQNFTQDCAEKEIDDEISSITKQLKKLKYKRKEIQTDIERGLGSISTPDFTYYITVEQSEDDSSEYILTRTLDSFNNSRIIENKEFNSIFSNHFDQLKFGLSKSIEIEKLIDGIEDLDDESIEIEYDSANLSSCIIKIENLDYEILVEPDYISITYYRMTSPKLLAEAFEKTHSALLKKPEIKLLG